MCSYNSLNGVPTCGNKDLLNGVLRNRWDWDGFVVSDCKIKNTTNMKQTDINENKHNMNMKSNMNE